MRVVDHDHLIVTAGLPFSYQHQDEHLTSTNVLREGDADDDEFTRLGSVQRRSFPQKMCIVFSVSVLLLVVVLIVGTPSRLLDDASKISSSPAKILYTGKDFHDSSQTTSEQHQHHDIAIVSALLELNSQLDGTILFGGDEDIDSSLSDDEDDGITTPSSSFERAAQVWRVCQAAPFAVIEVATERDVQLALPVLVALKEDYDFSFRVRSGGHHKAGYSTIDQRGAVLSLAKMNGLQVMLPPTTTTTTTSSRGDEKVIVRMEPGVQVRQFLGYLLGELDQYAGVVGACSSVAEGGFVLGGGFGFQSRLYGLGVDSVASIRVVLSDGQALSVTHGDDLFWALRGAGSGNFGVMTQMDYHIYPAEDRAEGIMISVDFSDLAHAMYQIGVLNSEIPRTMMVFFDMVDPKSRKAVITFGVFGQDVPSSEAAIAFVRNQIIPLLSTKSPVSYEPFVGKWTDQVSDNFTDIRVDSDDAPESFIDWGSQVWAAQAWCGFLLPENNTEAVWNEISRYIEKGLSDSSYLQPDVELWGAAISDVPSNATAFAFREAVYNVGVLLTIPKDLENAEQVYQEQAAQVNAWWPKVATYLTGVYTNYPMSSLSEQEYPRAYWGDNLERLVKIKQQYDPSNVFSYEQSVPTSYQFGG